jgi:LL-diaminopimelate aminotransferase
MTTEQLTTADWTIEKAQRLQALPPYLFVEVDKTKRRLREQGVDVIDLGVGDPDLPTPTPVIDALKRTVDDPANHRYSFSEGLKPLREAIAEWYQRRFSVTLDPDTQVLPLLGSKEGIANLPLALINPGDAVLVPDPCYPPYRSGTIFAGGEVVSMPLLAENNFLPDFGDINQRAARRAKLMFLNYPNNPTAAVASDELFADAVELAKAYQVVIAHDAAYTEIAFDGFKPASFLQTPEAIDVGVEFHSVSKTFNMTGWRVGFVCGNADVIAALRQLKTNIDSGIFQPVQYAAIAALRSDHSVVDQIVATYQRRRDLFVDRLTQAGWAIPKPKASLYVWAPVPGKGTSIHWVTRILEQAHVVATPGSGFGAAGEGFVRFSLTSPDERLAQAADQIAKIL